jgi:prepilin-type N-terminal cleavage/methylation domain-containing protein
MSAAGNSPRRQGQAGFTLIEMMATLAVAGLLTGLALPVFSSVREAVRLASGARALAGDLRAARGAALRGGVPVAVLLDPEGRGYRLAGSERVVPLPVGLTLRFAPSAFSAPGRLDFLPDGSASGGAIQVTGGRDARLVSVAPLTGAIAIGRPE